MGRRGSQGPTPARPGGCRADLCHVRQPRCLSAFLGCGRFFPDPRSSSCLPNLLQIRWEALVLSSWGSERGSPWLSVVLDCWAGYRKQGSDWDLSGTPGLPQDPNSVSTNTSAISFLQRQLVLSLAKLPESSLYVLVFQNGSSCIGVDVLSFAPCRALGPSHLSSILGNFPVLILVVFPSWDLRLLTWNLHQICFGALGFSLQTSPFFPHIATSLSIFYAFQNFLPLSLQTLPLSFYVENYLPNFKTSAILQFSLFSEHCSCYGCVMSGGLSQ